MKSIQWRAPLNNILLYSNHLTRSWNINGHEGFTKAGVTNTVTSDRSVCSKQKLLRLNTHLIFWPRHRHEEHFWLRREQQSQKWNPVETLMLTFIFRHINWPESSLGHSTPSLVFGRDIVYLWPTLDLITRDCFLPNTSPTSPSLLRGLSHFTITVTSGSPLLL